VAIFLHISSALLLDDCADKECQMDKSGLIRNFTEAVGLPPTAAETL
jgi:hypothetical protein